jgi:putative flavoprotein involved in K+ transport
MPRRYRGRDLIWWLSEMGIDRTAVEKRGPDATLPLITGAYGGHTIDLRAFAAHGITLLGRLRSGNGHALEFADDLGESIAYGDAAYAAFLDLVDTYVDREKLNLPEEAAARFRLPDPPCITTPVRQLNIREAGLHSVIWATGYTFDFGWVDLPVFDANGAPVHVHGVSSVPGVYFIGLPWLSKMNSSFLSGVGEDAAGIAEHIHRRSVALAATT